MNANRLLAYYEKISDASDAIPRLRRFILDLAVRGKLVNQDPNDGAATDLDAAIPTEIMPPFGVPKSWNWVRLCALGAIVGGGTPSKARDDYWGGGIPWVSPKDMKIDYLSKDQMSISEAGVAGSAANIPASCIASRRSLHMPCIPRHSLAPRIRSPSRCAQRRERRLSGVCVIVTRCEEDAHPPIGPKNPAFMERESPFPRDLCIIRV